MTFNLNEGEYWNSCFRSQMRRFSRGYTGWQRWWVLQSNSFSCETSISLVLVSRARSQNDRKPGQLHLEQRRDTVQLLLRRLMGPLHQQHDPVRSDHLRDRTRQHGRDAEEPTETSPARNGSSCGGRNAANSTINSQNKREFIHNQKPNFSELSDTNCIFNPEELQRKKVFEGIPSRWKVR